MIPKKTWASFEQSRDKWFDKIFECHKKNPECFLKTQKDWFEAGVRWLAENIEILPDYEDEDGGTCPWEC